MTDSRSSPVRCPSCRHANHRRARFCANCGTRLAGGAAAADGTGLNFCSHCGQSLAPTLPAGSAAPGSYTPRHLAERILTSRAAMEGEHKQVTVLFADLENFTALGDRLDSEDLHRFMDRVFAILLDVIHHYEGTINQFTGDGVMALFGAPIALEDHALRAAEASLEIQRTMFARADEFRAEFSCVPLLRIGINSGRVVVGKIGDDLRMDYTAQGDTVNLAARLQAVAEAGTIAASAATQRLVAGAIECVSLGPHRLKGKAEPVEVFRLASLVAPDARAIRSERASTPFVGRETELERLLRLFVDARAGRPRVAVVTGEAGIGKTRLLLEWRRRLGEGAARWLVGHCAPYGASTPYRPLVEIVRALFGISEADGPESAGPKIDALLAGLGEDGPALSPALRWVLAVGPPDAGLALVSPGDRKTIILSAFHEVITRLARRAPHVFVVDGCQWIDPATEEYLALEAERLTAGAVMFVLVCRPPDVGRPPLAVAGEPVALAPLTPTEARAVVAGLAGHALSPDTIALVSERTGGNPLFIEEVLQRVDETGAVRIPPKVEDLLMARVDRLPPRLKSLLQTASVIGPRFPRAVLERVSDEPAALAPSLGELLRLGLIAETDDGLEAYRYGQPLMQEVTYDGLLGQHRKALHRKIGLAIEELFPRKRAEYVEELARHFSLAEDWPRAVAYHRAAGRKAAGLCVNEEAVRWLERARELVSRLPENPDRTKETIDIYLELCRPMFQLGRLEDVLRLATEATSLARVVGDEARLAQVSAYLSNYHYMKGEPDLAIEFGLRSSPAGGDGESVPATAQYLGTSYHALGDYASAEDVLTRHVARLEASDTCRQVGPANLSYVSSCGWLAFTLLETGDFASAHQWARRGREAAALARHAYVEAIASTFSGLVWHAQGEFDRAVPLFEASLEICREHHVEVWRPIASALLGHAWVMVGKVEAGLELSMGALALADRLGVRAYAALWTALAAEGLLQHGQHTAALETARRALDLAIHNKERGNHARALHVLGMVWLRLGPGAFDTAYETLQQALEQADSLRMRPLAARCYLALAEIATRQGDSARAERFVETARTFSRDLGLRFWMPLAAEAGTPDRFR